MSMRAVAERVGLTSMALYPYVGGKDALLDGLVDLLHLELGTDVGDDPARRSTGGTGCARWAGPSGRWRTPIPGAFPLLLNRSAAGASASWLTAALRGILHDAGVPDDAGAAAGPDDLRVPARLHRPARSPAACPTDDGRAAARRRRRAEFDADLDDLVRLVEVAVRVGVTAVPRRSGGRASYKEAMSGDDEALREFVASRCRTCAARRS